MGKSVIWVFLGSYDLFRFGSEVLAIGDGCEDKNCGWTAN
jgi:hypothetical protein